MRGSHELVIVRHAKSDWSDERLRDIDRPLAARGRRQAPEAGRWIASHVALDLAVVSPAVRARQTWELVAAQLHEPPPVLIDDRIYHGWGDELLDVVRTLPENASRVALVGHNPGLEELIASLTGREVRMPTSAIAIVDLTDTWSAAAGHAVLRTSGRPPA